MAARRSQPRSAHAGTERAVTPSRRSRSASGRRMTSRTRCATGRSGAMPARHAPRARSTISSSSVAGSPGSPPRSSTGSARGTGAHPDHREPRRFRRSRQAQRVRDGERSQRARPRRLAIPADAELLLAGGRRGRAIARDRSAQVRVRVLRPRLALAARSRAGLLLRARNVRHRPPGARSRPGRGLGAVDAAARRARSAS